MFDFTTHKAIALIPASYRGRGILLMAGLLFGSLLDLVSLSAFLPILLLILNDSPDLDTWPLIASFELSDTQMALWCIGLIAVLVFIKSLYHHYFTWFKARYAYSVSATLAERGMSHYLGMSYLNFRGKDFTTEMNRISNLPLTFANNIIIPVGTLLSESFLFACLLVAVAIYNIQSFLLMVVILVPAMLIYRIRGRGIRKTSGEIKSAYPQLLKYTLQAVEGWPDIVSFQKERFFKDRFVGQFKKLGKILSADHSLHQGTARITELVAVLCVSALVVYVFLTVQSTHDSLLLLGIYAGASFRAIPSVSRILSAAHQVQSHHYVVSELLGLQNAPIHADTPEQAVVFKKQFELSGVSFAYTSKPVLEDVWLTIRKGESVLIRGSSGEGKTTLMLLCLGLLEPTAGKVSVDGMNLAKPLFRSWRKKIGYIPQDPYILDASISENIAFGVPRERINVEKVDRILHNLQLGSWVSLLKEKSDTIVGEKGVMVSGGQKQRLAVGRALYHDVEILLLDEITNQLDAATETEILFILKTLSDQGITVLLIAHHLSDYHIFDRIYKLKNGRLQDCKAEMLTP